MQTSIAAIDYYLPNEIVKTSELLAEAKSDRFDIHSDFIYRILGIEEVRHSPTKTRPSFLASQAAEKMLLKWEYQRQDIDAIIFCGIDRDYIEPSTAHYVQHNLGIDKAECKDISNACLGFMTGLRDADMMIRTGEAKHVLVCTGECTSELSRRLLPFLKKEKNNQIFRDKLGAFTVGDAGAAAIVSESHDGSGFKGMNFVSYGHLAPLCYYYYNNDGIPDGQMLMKDISQAILDAHRDLLPLTKAKLNIDSSEISCLITHQVGKRPWLRYPDIMGVSKQLMTKTFDKLGNITSATFAVNYKKALEAEKIKKGDFVFAAMAGSGLTVCQVGLQV